MHQYFISLVNMRLQISKIILPVICSICVCTSNSEAAELKKSNYEKQSNEMGIVLIDVSWGRKWGCAQYENAQLESLQFDNISSDEMGRNEYTQIKLESPYRIFVDKRFINYGFIVEPGKYAFTEWVVKVAKSVRDVSYRKAGREQLVDGKEYHGGTFEVGAGEIVYIGNIFLDCYDSPIPWRYYTEGKENYRTQVKQYKSKFKFLKNKEITYRLLDTKNYGSKYSLPK